MSGIINSVGARSGVIGSTEIPGGYEEGNWTIDIYDAATSGNIATKGNSSATYTKIGNQVILQGYMAVTAKGSMVAGQHIFIRGLPFSSTTASRVFAYGTVWLSSATYTGELIVNINTGGLDYARINIQVTGAEPSYMPVSALDANLSELKINIVYATDS